MRTVFARQDTTKRDASRDAQTLRKLKRQDLLEVMLDQMRTNDNLSKTNAELMARAIELTELTGRLKARLDEKDAQLERLKSKLDDKDAQIEALKPKLNAKDAKIERLKGKLDAKDERIAELEQSARAAARSEGALSVEELLEVEERAIRHYLSTVEAKVQGTDQAAPEDGGELA